MSGSSEETGAPRPAADPPARASLAHAIGSRTLIIIIVTMPLVFILAVMAVIAIVGAPERRAARALAPALTPASPSAAFPETLAPLVLPEGATIGAMALDGDRLAIRIDEAGGGGEIVIYDLKSGARLGAIAVRKGQ